jgi:MFS superfamily sulfate permease-like transporter
LRDLWSIAGAIAGGKVNWVEFALGAATLAVILLVKSRKRFPGILVAMIGATAVAYFFDLAESAHISVLGSLPRCPTPFNRATAVWRLSIG